MRLVIHWKGGLSTIYSVVPIHINYKGMHEVSWTLSLFTLHCSFWLWLSLPSSPLFRPLGCCRKRHIALDMSTSLPWLPPGLPLLRLTHSQPGGIQRAVLRSPWVQPYVPQLAPGQHFAVMCRASLRRYFFPSTLLPILPSLLLLQQYFDGWQCVPSHTVPCQGPPCRGSQGHAITHR